MFEEKTIVEDGANGEIQDVLIAPVGQFVGSDGEGNPIEQNFTQDALSQIADDLNARNVEVLMDKDHASARKGLERDTQSLGWFSKFVASAKGLFGLLKLTKIGREMIGNREYRHVSPVFALNQDKEPIRLLSVAATNLPAIAVPENIILNSEPEQSNSEDILDMTKEELITIVNEAIEAKLTAINQKTTEEVVVNQEGEIPGKESCNEKGTCNEKSCNEKATCETPDENATEVEEEKKEATEVADETDDATEEKTEVAEEVAEEKTEVEDATEVAKTTEVEDETTEVVKEEVLNTAPATTVPTVEEEWKKLKGEDFRKWCSEHAQFCNSYKA